MNPISSLVIFFAYLAIFFNFEKEKKTT